ncbi:MULTISPECIES: hypothetical protein [Pseudomonas]|uniref:hypothetical protein n=1 Tax=Pseudomonas TaxID=286 RepID=UPI0013DEEF6E|nr:MULTISPECIES: hypothetical protein [Pseudomonas]MCE0912584.1 hypothetical protein [Pseudomonas kurunegalensis]QIG16894.1 hypothetical protein FY041_03595 [Pseudomonas monteilii]QIG22154.1 hypothetical protein FY043_03595 [Pseudomonas monteilii]WJR56648.1 hypothetical protein LU664_003495 [Pseudomonas kurunegalensis]
MSTTVDPTLIHSCLLFVLGASLILNVLLLLLLIESKKAISQTETLLDASTQRQLALHREQGEEIEALEQLHLERLAATAMHHQREVASLMQILGIADQERDAAIKAASDDQRQVKLMHDRIAYLNVLMETWATGDDATAAVVKQALQRDRNLFS